MQDPEIKEMLADLIWLNALIATELIQVTENTSVILRKSPPPESCIKEHNKLRETALQMAEKYRPGTILAHHLGKHQ
jgi:phosphoribosyl 1,2-cyclic phosphodiesterase